MTIRDVLVTIEETKATPVRLELAAWLAARFEAHLIGLHAAPLSADSSGPTGFDTALRIAARLEASKRPEAPARARFEQVVSNHGAGGEWRLAADWSGAEIAVHARYADLAIVGQLAPDED